MDTTEPDLDDVPNRVSVRTDPDAGYASRYKTLLEAKEALGETSKTKAILAACRHTERDRRGKRRTLEYLSDRLTPEELAEVCLRLSTSELQLAVSFDSGLDSELEIKVSTN